jgi:N-ethylmaleimide reductase
MTTPDLFALIQLGPYMLNNRIVMAPMTRSRADEAGVVQAMTATYYAQRASAGLIVSEATQIHPTGKGYIGTPGIHHPEQVAAWQTVTTAVHAAGGRIFLQLWHVGRISHRLLQPDGVLPVAPSAIRPEGQAYTPAGLLPLETPRALTLEEIPGIVAQYRTAAQLALQAGFDGVEVHAANGYLLDQFLRDGSNQRTDAYGGSVANRSRLLLEVLDAVVDVCGADRVGVRLSPTNGFNDMRDSDPQSLFNHVVTALNPYRLAFLDVVGNSMSGEAPAFDYAALRACYTGGIFIASGGYDKASAQATLASGYADLVAFGTPYIANPDLVARLQADVPLAQADRATFYGGGVAGYIDYPVYEPVA